MSKCWYCNEELTTANYCDEHIGICTKCYGSMFKVSNKFVKGLTDKIADLEAKLAESELKYNATNRAYWELVEKQDNAFSQYEKLIGENQQLKKQFAEKDAEVQSWKDGTMVVKLGKLEEQLAEKEGKIETLKQRIDSIVKIYSDDFVSKDTELKELRHKVKQHNQDKILFTLEQLEKVKEKLLEEIGEFEDE